MTCKIDRHCGCSCHVSPGVMHIRPCCDALPATTWKGVVPYDKDRDPGDEREEPGDPKLR